MPMLGAQKQQRHGYDVAVYAIAGNLADLLR
jgi:hypothetical protein